ncbi:hypothetical protein [Micromonospora trifolii]|uniref:hypothetical protein n=1 Tax=Micromonospora trifolii TaxID=2911208 RepID=UPI003CF6FDD3
MRTNWPGSHPVIRRAGRFWVARASAWQLVTALVLFVAAVSAAFTVAAMLTTGPEPTDSGGPNGFPQTWLATARSLLGAEDFPRQDGNTWHEFLATLASLLGAVTPAAIIGIVMIRVFATEFFTWRAKGSLSSLAELRSDTAGPVQVSTDGIIAIRFYKKIHGVTLSDIRARAYLAFRSTSLIDGSTFFKREQLQVLSPEATEVEERVWPRVDSCMPLTLWIPLKAPLRDGRATSVQGRELDSRTFHIFVVVEARVAGLNISVHDQHSYALAKDFHEGRAVPIEPDLTRRPRDWRGWDRFDEPATYGIFAYGSLVAPETVSDLLGRPAREGVDYCRATLDGWRRTWSVCTDNTGPGRIRYQDLASGDEPEIQVLFLNAEPDAAAPAALDGILILVRGEQLVELDKREGNYHRTVLTTGLSVPAGTVVPDVVWIYTGRQEQVDRARQGIVMGTARIRQEYLDSVCKAHARHQGLLENLERYTSTPPGVSVVSLRRIELPATQAAPPQQRKPG